MQDNPLNLLFAFFAGAFAASLFACLIRCCCGRVSDRRHAIGTTEIRGCGPKGFTQAELARLDSPDPVRRPEWSSRPLSNFTPPQRHLGPPKIYTQAELDHKLAQIQFDWQYKIQAPSAPANVEVMFFPDASLPCIFYRDGLISGTNWCGCNRAAHKDKVHFGDKPTTLIRLWECLACARQIDLCIYRFTLTDTAKLLIDLKRRGVQVRVIADVTRKEDQHDQIPELQKAGIEVREKEKLSNHYQGIMHHKFAILDDKIVFNGSFNWTFTAVKFNNESLIKIEVPSEVRKFRQEFDKIWSESDESPHHHRVNMSQ